MSLEQALAANTAAVTALHALLANAIQARGGEPPLPIASPSTVEPAAEAPAPAPSPKSTAAAKPAATARTAPTAAAAAVDAPAKKAASSAPAPKTLSYDPDVKVALVTYQAKFGREGVVDLLSRYGVTRGVELKPAVFAQIITEAEQAIESGEAV